MKRITLLGLAASLFLVSCVSPSSSRGQESSFVSVSSSNQVTSSNQVSSSTPGPSSSQDSSSSQGYSSNPSSSEGTFPTDAYGDYYKNCLSWSDGADLKAKLVATLHNGFTSITYDGNWATIQKADQALDNLDAVDQIYSEDPIRKDYTKGFIQTGYDREHCFAKTLMGYTDTSVLGPATDFHNLYASWTTANNSRNNKNLGDVANPTGTIGVNKYDNTTFEPGSPSDKGKESRAIFYMATMWSGTEYGLYVRDEVCSTGEKCHGNLKSLLEWNANEVTRGEYQHNIRVYEDQKNRNPYVDYPGLVDYVFGSKKDQAGSLLDLEPTILKLGIASGGTANYAIKDVKFDYTTGDTFSKTAGLTVVTIAQDYSVGAALTAFTLTGVADGETFSTAAERAISVLVGNQTIVYTISIKEDPLSACVWSHTFDKTDFTNGTVGQVNTVTLDGLPFSTYIKNGAVTYFTNNAAKGLQVGTSTVPPQEIVISSVSSFSFGGKTAISGVYFEGNIASGTTATLSVSVGQVQVFTGAISYSGTVGKVIYGQTVATPASGIVSFSLTGITKAIYLSRIGINVA